MSVVNTNVSASLAQSALMRNERALGSAMEQLSTGSKINSASDDAAGLAMAAKFTSQINGLDMAVKNANDGISMISTAEGALNEVTNMLQRMRELAVQSSNGTMTSDDRDYMNKEYQALNSEIDRIEQNTTWNGVKILSGNAGQGGSGSETATVNFQVSANYAQGATTTTTTKTNLTLTSAVPGAITGTGALTSIDKAGGGGKYAVSDLLGLLPASGSTAATGIKADGEVVYTTSPSGVLTGTNTGAEWAEAMGKAHTKSTSTSTAASNDIIAVDFGTLTTATGSDLSNVSNQSNAQGAVKKLDDAIKGVNTQRATFGAASNRLTHAVDNMTNIRVNAEASRSRIEDTDYAQTTSELAKAQIIAQAGTAMLAQANQSAQSVLSLLR
ncbi:MAG: flagellin [Pseudomonadota bacterium]|nr:flagellin [Pseudomonadota bacterium]